MTHKRPSVVSVADSVRPRRWWCDAHLSLLGLLVVYSLLAVTPARADLAGEYARANQELKAIRGELNAVKKARETHSKPPVSEDDLVELARIDQKLSELYDQLGIASLTTANKLVSLTSENPVAPGGREDLMRSYRIAKLYTDAGHCELASPSFEHCRVYAHKLRTFKTSRGTPLSRVVATNERRCEMAQGVIEEEIRVDAKAAYIDPALRPLLIDSRPYTMDEVETLLDRLVPIEDAADKEEILDRLGIEDSERALVEPPFVLVAGPGQFPERAVRMQKVLPGRESEASELASVPLRSVYDAVVLPVWTLLRREFFDRFDPEFMIPIYLAGGPLSTEGLLGWSAYCLEIHGRRCGLSLGYYLEHDNSVAVWLTTGGGTLAHELVHALMATDFPDAPMWIDEGISSLHEVTKDGEPIDNYRHYYVESALDRYTDLIPVEALVSVEWARLTTPEIRNLYVALVRSFAHFLHERDVLASVYKRIRTLDSRTPEAQIAVLTGALGVSDSTAIHKEWTDWAKARSVASDWEYLREGALGDLGRLGRTPPWRR